MSNNYKIVTKNFPMSRKSYKDGLNSSRDNVHCADSTNDDISEEISGEENDLELELENSYTSDENVNDSNDWTNTSRTSKQNYDANKRKSNLLEIDKEKALSAEINEANKRKSNLRVKDKGNALNEKNNDASNFKYIVLLIIVAILIPLYIVPSHTENNTYITLDTLHVNFPTKTKVITNIDHVINDTLQIDPTHPAVFLLLYTGDDKIINNFTHNLALYAAKLLQTDSDYIEIQQNEFQSKEIRTDYGILIDKYRTKLENKGVMIVKDLQDIPANVAQVFHTFCDEISPLVARAVYLLTLKVKSLNGKEETIAESALNENWNELDVDILSPLVTRITSTVLKIENEL